MFPVPPSVKRELSDTSALAQQLRRWAERQVPTELDIFPAEITGVSSGFHAWTEQAFDSNADRYDKPGGRSGTVNGVGGETVTWMPARRFDGSSLGGLPKQVWLVRAGLDTTAEAGPPAVAATGPNYEILEPGSGPILPVTEENFVLSIINGVSSVAGGTTLTLADAGTWQVVTSATVYLIDTNDSGNPAADPDWCLLYLQGSGYGAFSGSQCYVWNDTRYLVPTTNPVSRGASAASRVGGPFQAVPYFDEVVMKRVMTRTMTSWVYGSSANATLYPALLTASTSLTVNGYAYIQMHATRFA